jgi:hypothetical protein
MSMKQWQLSITIQTSSTEKKSTQVSTHSSMYEPILLLSYILQHGNPSVRECLRKQYRVNINTKLADLTQKIFTVHINTK